jgi:hypothetical protein
VVGDVRRFDTQRGLAVVTEERPTTGPEDPTTSEDADVLFREVHATGAFLNSHERPVPVLVTVRGQELLASRSMTATA